MIYHYLNIPVIYRLNMDGQKTTTKNDETTELDNFINLLKLCGADSPHLTHIERVILIEECMKKVI